jgi:hypothetical protein
MVALCMLGACSSSNDEGSREHCGTGSACAEPPADRQCVEQSGASICALKYQFVVQVAASGLQPDSSLSIVSGGQSTVYPVTDEGILSPGQVSYPPVSDVSATFAFGGSAADGTAVNGSVTLVPLPPNATAP